MAKCHRPMTYCHNFSLFKYKTCKNTIKNSEHSVIQRVLNVSTFQEMLHFVSFSVWWLILYYGTWVGKSVLGGVISEGECPSQLHTQNKTSSNRQTLPHFYKIFMNWINLPFLPCYGMKLWNITWFTLLQQFFKSYLGGTDNLSIPKGHIFLSPVCPFTPKIFIKRWISKKCRNKIGNVLQTRHA